MAEVDPDVVDAIRCAFDADHDELADRIAQEHGLDDLCRMCGERRAPPPGQLVVGAYFDHGNVIYPGIAICWHCHDTQYDKLLMYCERRHARRKRKQPSNRALTWEQAEKLFPECSAAFDRDGGDDWLQLFPMKPGSFEISVLCGDLVAWYGVHPGFVSSETGAGHWAFWDGKKRRWMFLGLPGGRTQRADAKSFAEQP